MVGMRVTTVGVVGLGFLLLFVLGLRSFPRSFTLGHPWLTRYGVSFCEEENRSIRRAAIMSQTNSLLAIQRSPKVQPVMQALSW